jgi:hypothetical protein
MRRDVGRNDPCPCGSGQKFKKCCIDRPSGPAIELIEEEGERWRIELRNFKQLHDALGRDVMNGFCRCLIHADRLTSLISFAWSSKAYYGGEATAYSRDLRTMIWFAIGTLRELALAIRGLRNALAKRKMLDANSAEWTRLREIERRWNDDFFVRMRNVGAFHVDSVVIDKGLDELVKERDVVLVRGQGSKNVHALYSLGVESLQNGLDLPIEDYGEFLEKVVGDLTAGETIQQALALSARAVGVPFRRLPPRK